MKNSSLFHVMWRGLPLPRTAFAVSVLLLSLLSFPAFSPAIDLSGGSNTYLSSRQAADNTKILGAYEYLDFAVGDIGSEAISFHAGGWLRYDLRGEEFGKQSNSDLQYSYLSFKGKTANTTVNLGRIMVFEGAAAERVDGLYARTDLQDGFGISAFGGSPVETGTDASSNKLIYGARLSNQADAYRIGISALKEDKDSADFRKQAGVDVWLHPLDKVDITGRSIYDAITYGWMEHAYAVSLGPFGRLRLNTEGSWIDYDAYFPAGNLAAFAIKPGIIEPHEKVLILGEEVVLSLTDSIVLSGDYRNFDYDIAKAAYYYGGKIRFGASPTAGAGIGLHRMEGSTDLLKYSEYRVYGFKKFGKLDIAADVFDVFYDVARNGVHDAYSASLAAAFNLTEALKIGADVEYAKNPDFNKDVRGFFKLLYRFGTKGGA